MSDNVIDHDAFDKGPCCEEQWQTQYRKHKSHCRKPRLHRTTRNGQHPPASCRGDAHFETARHPPRGPKTESICQYQTQRGRSHDP